MVENKKGYGFAQVEARIKKLWEDKKIFAFDPSQKSYFSVDMPPPTVSGAMHIGHAFSYSQQDFIARFRRMRGAVFYPFGTDDNGLPTERLVERLKNVKSKEMSRPEFIALCLKTLKEITPEFVQDWKNLGISADYDLSYSTIDDNARKISQTFFLDLYKKGQIYKAGFPTIWCPECQTAIAQAELEDQTKNTDLVYIKAKLDDGRFIVYATTRPELHPGCIGISLNEEGMYVNAKKGGETWVISKEALEKIGSEFGLVQEKEFAGKELVGLSVNIPFAKKPVVVSHDVSAKTEYGTGIVYYCSYGGLDCVQWLTRHPGVSPIDVMSPQGVYTQDPIKGLGSLDARKKIVELLDQQGVLIKKEGMSHVVNTHDKCGTDIEFIRTPQWFIKIMDKKDALIEQGNKIRWYPKHMHKRFDNWVKGLEWDWNISRNRHFGVPIPAWECKSCNQIIVADESELPVDPLQLDKKCSSCGNSVAPEEMVLDTWATSSLTPQIAASLTNYKIPLPYTLRPQGHDIIRTWAFYTILRAHLSEDKIPWENIMISGNVSLKGEKMSKSKGNVIDPKKVLDEYGADALRFWAAGSKLGGDLDYQEQDLVAGKKTITKLWNASKFVFMNLEGFSPDQKPQNFEMVDVEFQKMVNGVVKSCTEALEAYEYSKAKLELEKFFWKDFCDNYLEIIKKRVYQGSGDAKLSAQWTLYDSLYKIIKLFAPLMPFITDEIYQTYFKGNEGESSVHVTGWPKVLGDTSSAAFETFIELLTKVRQEKTNNKKSMNSLVVVHCKSSVLSDMLDDFKNVTNAQDVVSGNFKVEFVE